MLLCLLSSPALLLSQTSCPASTGWVKPVPGSIFNDEQEIWLGDAIADFIEHRYAVITEPAENAYLEKIGKGLLAALPPTGIRFRFVLIDSSDVNGFSLAGGRIYITRKLIANARSEDEVAGVLAHEIGHIVTHQSAAEISDAMRRLISVNSVTDRADIYDKFRRLMDAERNDTRRHSDPDSDANQNSADRVAVYALAAAGYQPQSYAEFWDRSFFVEGKTGNSLSDFFGMTKPSQKRLRQIRQIILELPKGCGTITTSASQDFHHWQNQVIANQRSSVTEKEVAGQHTLTLQGPVRMDLQKVRFSRDGKYLFAQDESSIFVLQREPLKFLFRIDADSAEPAEWSPDSSKIVFHNSRLHVEEWSVAQQKLAAAHEMVIKDSCVQTVLSPDGRTLACISFGDSGNLSGFTFNLALIDTETNQVVFRKNSFYALNTYGALYYLSLMRKDQQEDFFLTVISQDGNFLVIGADGDTFRKIAFDLRTRTQIKLGGDFNNTISSAFAFSGENIAGEDLLSPKNSGWFSFPDGKRLGQLSMHLTNLKSVSKGEYLLSRDEAENQVLVLDLKSQHATGLPKTKNVDMWGNSLVLEAQDGALSFGQFDPVKPKEMHIDAREMLPLSPLGQVQIAELSANGRFLAISGKSRGAVWDLNTGSRLFLLRGFDGAFFNNSGRLYLAFPKYDKVDRHILQVDLTTKEVGKALYPITNTTFIRSGHLQEWKEGEKQKSSLIVRDLETGTEKWTRKLDKDRPTVIGNYADSNLVMLWSASSAGGKAEAKNTPALAAQLAALKDKDAGLIAELISIENGSTLKSVVLVKPSASLLVDDLNIVDDTFLMTTRDNRVLLYSAKTGELKHQVFGYVVGADSKSRLFCVKNRRDEAFVYDLEGKEIAHFQPGTPVRFAKFEDNGKKLLLLGADQKVRVMTLEQQAVASN
jgi:hypothetical protein